MGLDIGDKRIGVALSDPGEILASPLTIIITWPSICPISTPFIITRTGN